MQIQFAKTGIICHGARATRQAESLIRYLSKYLSTTDFVKGNIEKEERDKMWESVSLISLINYPNDLEKIDTGLDVLFQIVYGDDEIGLKEAISIKEKTSIPTIALVINGVKDTDLDIPYIELEENEIKSIFLDLFSVYTFPQEYGADFEELTPLFNHNGKIQASTEFSSLEDASFCLVFKGDFGPIDCPKNTQVVLTSRKYQINEAKRCYFIVNN